MTCNTCEHHDKDCHPILPNSYDEHCPDYEPLEYQFRDYEAEVWRYNPWYDTYDFYKHYSELGIEDDMPYRRKMDQMIDKYFLKGE